MKRYHYGANFNDPLGDDPIFEDLGLSAKEYSKVQITW